MEDYKSADPGKTLDSSFPFEMQPLFNLNHLNTSFDTLKNAMEFLANQQKEQSERIFMLEEDGSHSQRDFVASAISSRRGGATPAPIRELKEQVKKNKDEIFELKMSNKQVLEKFDSLQAKVTMLDKNVDILKTMSGTGTGEGPDLNGIMEQLADMNKKSNESLSQMIGDNYQKQQEQIEELQDKQREMKDTDEHLQNEIDNIKRLLSGIGAKVNTLSGNFTSALSESQEKLSQAYKNQPQLVEEEPAVDHTEDIAKLWVEIRRLRDGKCDMDIFEARMLKIDEYFADDQGQLDNLASNIGRGRSGTRRVEMDELNIDGWNKAMEMAFETDKKVDAILSEVGVGGFASMKQSIQKIQQKLNESVDKAEITKTINEMKAFAGKLDQMIFEVEENGRVIAELKKNIGKLGKAPTIEDFQLLRTRVDNCENHDDKLRKMINEVDKKVKLLKNSQGGNPDGGDLVEKCVGELQSLRSNFEEHRDISMKNLKSINEQILNKLDKSDMAKIEKQFEEMFQVNNMNMGQKFASKEETARKFTVMSKKVRELVEQVQKMGQEEGDGMFTKKNFGPVNCASCEKNLTNMSGLPVDHSNWKKLPFREGANDRIARYAQGFSKMLSTLQPDESQGGKNQQSVMTNMGMTPNVSYLDRMQNSSSPFNQKMPPGQHFQSVSWDETNAQQSAFIPTKNYHETTPGAMPFQSAQSPITGMGHVTHTTLPSSGINQGYLPMEAGPSHKTSASFFKPTLLNSNSGQGQNIYLPNQQQQAMQISNQYGDKRHSSNTRNINNGSGALYQGKMNSPLHNVQPLARGSRSPDIGVGQHLLPQNLNHQEGAFQNNTIQNHDNAAFQQHNDVLPQLTARNHGPK